MNHRRFFLLLLLLRLTYFATKASIDRIKDILCKPLLCRVVFPSKCRKRPLCRLLRCCPPRAKITCTGIDNRTCCEDYDNYTWSEFSPQQQDWWEDLGWDELQWESEGKPSGSIGNEWEDLIAEEKDAARELCYDHDSWNGCPEELECTPTPNDCNGDNYESQSWRDLVYIGLDDEAAVLGYDEIKWDEDVWVVSEDTDWIDLTPEEKAAAEAFCWTQETWDEGGDVCLFVDSRTCCFDVALYEELYWAMLSPDQQAAWTVLGWTEEIWDDDGTVPSDDLYWYDLSAEQQAAGYELCLDNDSWNGCPPLNCTGDEVPVNASLSDDCNGDNYNSYSWAILEYIELDDEAAQLGYNQISWDTDASVWSDSASWGDLTPEQQAAAEAFCWTQETWDFVCLYFDNRTCCFNLALYDEFDWDHMSPEQQAAWEVLNWTQQLWDDNGTVPTDDLDWSELSDEQRNAGYDLCFDHDSWNECPANECTGVEVPFNTSLSDDCNGDNYNSYSWTLLEYVQLDDEATTLGYDETSWDNGEFVEEVDCANWTDLSPDQQTAAAGFCYNETTWDSVGPEDCLGVDNRTCTNNTDALYGGLNWNKLPDDVQQYYEDLGWARQLWMGQGSPVSDCKVWDQLTTIEQAAATALCFDNDSWNECQ